MVPFRDQVGEVSERSTERMNFRTKPRIKETIQRAAALAGVDDSVFTMNAAYRSAIETIAAHERTTLRSIDHAAFFAAIDSPPAPTGNLRAAFDRHRTTVVSRDVACACPPHDRAVRSCQTRPGRFLVRPRAGR